MPVFADIDQTSGSITAETIAPLITPRTKAIVVVHLGGWPADMHSICDLARAHGIAVVEDCAQAMAHQLMDSLSVALVILQLGVLLEKSLRLQAKVGWYYPAQTFLM